MYQNQRAWNYDVERLGFRYHMANLHAAIGLAQLRKFDEIVQTRQETFQRLRDGLSDLSWLRTRAGESTTSSHLCSTCASLMVAEMNFGVFSAIGGLTQVSIGSLATGSAS